MGIEHDAIALVNVPSHEGSLEDPISKGVYTKTQTPAVGLATINGVLLKAGYSNVATLDPRFNPRYGEFTKHDWERLYGSDVVGITSMTRNRGVSLEFIALIKERNPETIIIAGGSDPTFESEKWLAGERGADFVIRKEGEITIVELMKALRDGSSLENIKGISYKQDGEIRHNKERPLLTEKELSEVAFPFFPPIIRINSNTHAVEGSRGCPNRCDFCSVTALYNGTQRRKTDERIIAEIQAGEEGKKVFFVDDNFAHPSKLKEAKTTMQSIIANGLNDRDYILQLDTISVNRDPEFAKLCRKMGVLIVCLGVEHVDPNVLRGMRKAATADQNIQAIKKFQNEGIFVHAMTIVGSANETRESIEKLRRWIMKSGVNSVQIFPEGPVPGSELAKRVKVFERADRDTNLADGQHLVRLPPPGFTCCGLQQEIFQMYEKFYSTRHVLKALKPLSRIFTDPERALKLTLLNLAIGVYARRIIPLEVNSKYTQKFMDYLKEMDEEIARKREQEKSAGILNEGIIFGPNNP